MSQQTTAGVTQVLPGVVVGIVDGDTADVRLESGMIRIRLHGIDAPEMGQPYGSTARTGLSDLVYGKNVLVEPYEQDRYDRLVARIWFGERDINAEMIKSGFAWVYRRYAEDPRYCAYEKGARDLRQGLWQVAVAGSHSTLGVAQTQDAGRPIYGLRPRKRRDLCSDAGKIGSGLRLALRFESDAGPCSLLVQRIARERGATPC